DDRQQVGKKLHQRSQEIDGRSLAHGNLRNRLVIGLAATTRYNGCILDGRGVMSEFLHIHPVNPQPRLIARAVEAVRAGAVIAYPTDTAYALGCRIGEKSALERIRQIRALGDRHNFTLACRDLSDISTYAKVNNQNYRLLRTHTPGPYTFILPASREVPRMLQHPKRKTIGIRLPEHA